MEVDEPTPADFLFGKLPNSFDTLDRFQQPDEPQKLEILLLLTGLFYAITITIFLNVINPYNHSRETLGLVIGGIALLSMFSTWKNYIQLQRYGPDLQEYQLFSLKFMMVQSFISHLILITSLALAYAGLQLIQFVHPIATLVIFGLVGFFVYARMISNLSLISAGLGIGLLPSFGGLTNIMHNFRLLYQINGKKEYQLASLRVVFWVTIFGLIGIPDTILYQVLVIIGFTAAFINWEKVNGSSIIMQIRSLIQEMSPSTLPDISFNEDQTFIMSPTVMPTQNSSTSSYRDRPKKEKDSNPIKPPTKQEITPIAAQSINRIVSSIMKESQ